MIPLPFSHHYQWSPSIHGRPGIWMLLTITQPFGLRHPTVHCLLVSCICALLAIYTDPPAFPYLSPLLEASTIRRVWTAIAMVPPWIPDFF